MNTIERTPRQNGFPHGFTLIELMIAVAVVGILAAIAYPSYTAYVVRANRSAAASFLFQLANKEAQYMLDARTYTGTSTDLLSTPPEVAKFYDISITTAATPPGFTVQAAPKGTQATRDAACGTLTLDQNGTKGITGTGSVTDCWR
jgi:type IV pilus assembly protein PilE